jgi:hypothetical protein
MCVKMWWLWLLLSMTWFFLHLYLRAWLFSLFFLTMDLHVFTFFLTMDLHVSTFFFFSILFHSPFLICKNYGEMFEHMEYLFGGNGNACFAYFQCTWSWSWEHDKFLNTGQQSLIKLNTKTSSICGRFSTWYFGLGRNFDQWGEVLLYILMFY